MNIPGEGRRGNLLRSGSLNHRVAEETNGAELVPEQRANIIGAKSGRFDRMLSIGSPIFYDTIIIIFVRNNADADVLPRYMLL